MKKIQSSKGITLLALIITIIVLVILAGVALNTLFGSNGILNNSQYAKEQYMKSAEKEAIAMAFADLKIKLYTDDNISEITAELLQQQLTAAGYNVEVIDGENGNFVITFKNTGDQYEVTPNGSIVGEEKTDTVIQEIETEQESTIIKYIDDGILAYYDGTDNTREGHNGDSEVWEDLIGDKDIELRDFENNTADVWLENGIVLDGTNDGLYLGNNFKDLFKSDATLEIVLNIKDSSRDVFFGNYNQANNINFEKKTSLCTRAWWNNGSYDAESSNSIVTTGEKITLSFRVDKTKSRIAEFINGEKVYTYSSSKIGEYNYDWGNAWVGKDNRTSGDNVNFGGTIYKIRVYNRAISDKDILCNYMIDIGEEIKTGTGNVPIYNASNLGKMGSNEKIYIENEKKVYQFSLGKTYVLQNDITFYGDFSEIQNLIDTNQVELDKNGYALAVENYTNPDYFNYSIASDTATITGFSELGRTAYDNGELTEIIFPTKYEGLDIVGLGHDAFKSCNKLNKITILSNISDIGIGAFYLCSNINQVTISEGVLSIGESAFNACSSLTAITIPHSVTTIGPYAFLDCTSLTAITIPHNVTSIGKEAFARCGNLNSIAITGNISSVGEKVFQGCSNSVVVTISNGVTSLPNSLFSYCSGITSVTIPNSLTSIGIGAFFHCNRLTSVNIPNGTTTIEESTFNGCSSLTSITIPSTMTIIGPWAFLNCTSLNSITLPNTITSIEQSAFSGCTSLTSITIPDSVTSIAQSAFADCTNLESINIEGNISSAGEKVFKGCSNSVVVTINNGITSLPNSLFSYCSGITSVTIPSSVTSIGKGAFFHCNRLTSINIPNGITTIGESTFNGCSSLTSITMPSTITTIGPWAFLDCAALTDVTFNGTRAQWEAVTISANNTPLTSATIHCSDD